MRTPLFQTHADIPASLVERPTQAYSLFSLIQQQAEVHDCTTACNAHSFYQALNAPSSPSEAVLIQNEANDPVAYILYSHYVSSTYGNALYLEDICVNQDHRGAGYGQLAFGILAEIARNNHIENLLWSVMENNAQACGFYQYFGAEFTDKVNMDLENISPFNEVVSFEIVHQEHEDPANNSSIMRLISRHSRQCIAHAVLNKTLSSFRAVAGLQVEEIQINPTHNNRPEIYQQLLGAIHNYWKDTYPDNSHLFAYGREGDFVLLEGCEKLRMNHHINSTLRTMHVRSDAIPAVHREGFKCAI